MAFRASPELQRTARAQSQGPRLGAMPGQARPTAGAGASSGGGGGGFGPFEHLTKDHVLRIGRNRGFSGPTGEGQFVRFFQGLDPTARSEFENRASFIDERLGQKAAMAQPQGLALGQVPGAVPGANPIFSGLGGLGMALSQLIAPRTGLEGGMTPMGPAPGMIAGMPDFDMIRQILAANPTGLLPLGERGSGILG